MISAFYLSVMWDACIIIKMIVHDYLFHGIGKEVYFHYNEKNDRIAVVFYLLNLYVTLIP